MSTIERAMQRARQGGAAEDASEDELARAETVEHPALREREARERERPPVELDLDGLRERGYLTPAADQRDLQEQYRMVKRPLLGHAFGDTEPQPNAQNLVQVTSSVDAEGKTFTVFNLAVSIAMEPDFTVLMIDTDLTRRSLTHMAGLDQAPGITDVLTGEFADLGEVICRTNVPGMSIIPAGRSHPRASEMIASEAMRRITRELAGRYPDRVLLFDSTPLLMDSQASTLARHMGQVLVVVEAGRTSEKVLRDGLELIDHTRTRVGLLLNKSPQGYGHGYYGGYY